MARLAVISAVGFGRIPFLPVVQRLPSLLGPEEPPARLHGDLWAGNAISWVGFQITAVAVPVEVYAITGSSFWVGMIVPSATAPTVVTTVVHRQIPRPRACTSWPRRRWASTPSRSA